MKNIYVGIFETQNKIQIRIEDESGQLIGKKITGPINLQLSANYVWESIFQCVKKILSLNSIKLHNNKCVFHACLGLRRTQFDNAVQQLIRKNESNKVFKTFIVKSDCCVLALSKQPNHAAIIADEGIVGNAFTKTDRFKVGGWGFPFADKGSILWLGSEAYRYTLQWIEGSLIKPTPLLKSIYSYFNNNIATLLDWAANDLLNEQNQYRILSNMVLEFYNYGDKTAVDLIKKSAYEIERIYETMKKLTEDENIALSLYGELIKYVTPYLSINMTQKTHILDGAVSAIELAKRFSLLQDDLQKEKILSL